jgi:hypothetical protein
MILKWCRSERHGLIEGIIPDFSWRDWVSPWKTSVKIVGAWTEIPTGHSLNTSWKRHRLRLTSQVPTSALVRDTVMRAHVERMEDNRLSKRAVQGDSKLLSVFPWPMNGNPENNLESPYVLQTSAKKKCWETWRSVLGSDNVCLWTLKFWHAIRAGFKVEQPGPSLLGLHKTEMKSTNFTEMFAAVKSRRVSWYV